MLEELRMKSHAMMDIVSAPSTDFNYDTAKQFVDKRFVPLTFQISAAYLLMLYVGQRLMKNRAAYKLDTLLALWNATFALFSWVATSHLLPELLDAIQRTGVVGSYCDVGGYFEGKNGYWGFLFTLSKAAELGDSFFLVLRKRPVKFMHWYHHALTFIFTSITFSQRQAFPRWSLTINLMVHSVMYTYFMLKALKVNVPGWVSRAITSIQLAQFVVSICVMAHLGYIKLSGSRDCAISWSCLSIGAAMYLSYLVLFSQFFYEAYLKPKARKLE